VRLGPAYCAGRQSRQSGTLKQKAGIMEIICGEMPVRKAAFIVSLRPEKRAWPQQAVHTQQSAGFSSQFFDKKTPPMPPWY